MTLLLGIQTDRCVVLASDGLSSRTFSDGSRRIEARHLQELFPVSPHALAIAHHGENVLTGTPIGQRIGQLQRDLQAVPDVEELATFLIDKFHSAVLAMKKHLQQFNNGVGFWIAGFRHGTPALQEVFWTPNATIQRNVFPPGDVVWGGNGKPFAKRAFDQHRVDLQHRRRYTPSEAQAHLRAIYETAVVLQPGDVFGGMYQELTVTEEGCSWTHSDLDVS